MWIEKQTLFHHQFNELLEQVKANDLLVINNTKVISTRLFSYKKREEKLECLVERILSNHRFLAHIRVSKALKVGMGNRITIANDFEISVVARDEDIFKYTIDSSSILDRLY